MKNLNVIVIAVLLSTPLCAQSGTFVAGGGTVFNLPTGSLSSRFTGGLGGMIYAGQQIDDNWTWIARFEYFQLHNVNASKLSKKVTSQINGETVVSSFPLPKLSMNLTAAGLSAVGELNLLRESTIESNITFGFGFYHWKNVRGSYYDSLSIDTSGSGQMMKVADLAVPQNTQIDWSGTLTIGYDFNVKIIDPVWITIGADYKIIVGELWQALALDIENVSGMQFFSFRGGIHMNF